MHESVGGPRLRAGLPSVTRAAAPGPTHRAAPMSERRTRVVGGSLPRCSLRPLGWSGSGSRSLARRRWRWSRSWWRSWPVGRRSCPARSAVWPRGRLGVGLLMSTIALVGAVALGQYGEAASLAFLFSISEALEEWAVTRSRRGLRAVLSLVPDAAGSVVGAVTVEIASAELRIGDRMVLWAGERLPTDGVVVEGRSSLDVSAVTGESMPVDVESGSVVLAGSINGGGVLEIEATAATVDSTLARVVQAPLRRRRTAKAVPSGWPIGSPVRWCRGSCSSPPRSRCSVGARRPGRVDSNERWWWWSRRRLVPSPSRCRSRCSRRSARRPVW